MHIMEGFLAPQWAIGWGLLCVPFLIMGFLRMQQLVKLSQKNLVLLALCGAFAFVLSALKLPSINGSCSHPTGVGLGAIMLGPWVMSVIGLLVLLFQAVLLAHGGLTTLGANTFSMGIVGPFVSWLVYKGCRRFGLSNSIAVFLGAFLGDLLTYVTTSLQLALAYPDQGSVLISLGKFMSVFAVTQLPLAVCEGLVTVVMFNMVAQYQGRQLKELMAGQKGA